MSMMRLCRERRTRFVTLFSPTVEAIKHADALAVWAILMTKPDNWVVRQSWLRVELGIGRDRLEKGIGRLKVLGLWEVRVVRDPKTGKLKGREVIVREEVTEMPENRNFGKTRASGFPEAREIKQLLNTDTLLTEEKITKKQPAAGGKEDAHAKRSRLSFSAEFELQWSSSWDRYLPESRAVAILKRLSHEQAGLNLYGDTARVRRVLGEWASTCFRHEAKEEEFDPAGLLIHLIKHTSLSHTVEGDKRLPSYA